MKTTEMKGALQMPKGEDTFWWDTAFALMKGQELEILAEKGDLDGREQDDYKDKI